jgi:hypothetical protein
MAVPAPQPTYRPDLPTTFVADSEGWLLDPFSLEVEVATDDGDEAFPRTAVDLTDMPTGDRIGLGYFRAANYDPQDEDWGPTPDDDPGPGRRTLRWFCVLEEDGPELTWTTVTERLEFGAKPDLGVPYYALIADLRDEGFSSSSLSDAAAARMLAIASQYVEKFTGRRFVPEPRRISLDGRGGPMLMLGEPIIAASGVFLDDAPFQSSDVTLSRDILRVYNRHLSQRLRFPDDRNNPKLELFHPVDVRAVGGWAQYSIDRMTWPIGQQNCHVEGVYGYTDADGSPMGRTPVLIAQAAMMIVARVRGRIGSGDRGDTTSSGRVSMERTRDQAVSYDTGGSMKPGSPLLGAFTGDPEIDTILAAFLRPPGLGAV